VSEEKSTLSLNFFNQLGKEIIEMTLFKREFRYAAFYNINDGVLARVWYVVL
jgi:hypothetical protein